MIFALVHGLGVEIIVISANMKRPMAKFCKVISSNSKMTDFLFYFL